MKKRISFLLIILSLLFYVEATTYYCESWSENCTCSKNIRGDVNLQCPSYINEQASLEYKNEQDSLSLRCRKNITFPGLEVEYVKLIEDYNFLPKLPIHKVKEFEITDCPMHEDISTLLNLLNITKISSLKMESNTKIHLNKDYFKGIESEMKSLSITHSYVNSINPEVLYGMKNIINLELTETNMTRIYDSQFIDMFDLKVLDLSRNQINIIPKEAFKNLLNLKVLHLWMNLIDELDPETFEQLINLTSLELSQNNLQNIPENILENLSKLEKINLGRNNLTNIPKNLFKNNRELTSIRLDYNPLNLLPDYFFADFFKLENISISFCSLKELSNDLFKNSTKIQYINLRSNLLRTLPENIFDGLSELETLILDHNQISFLSDRIFKPTTGLIRLNLGYNEISQELTAELLSSAQNLKVFYINNNNISLITYSTFANLRKLRDVNMANNKLRFTEAMINIPPFANNVELETLNLSNNSITFFLKDFTKIHMKELNLNNNLIQTIDYFDLQSLSNNKLKIYLKNNNISSVNLENAEITVSGNLYEDALSSSTYQNNVVVYLDNNPIICDCYIYDLLRYYDLSIDVRVRQSIEIISSNLYCAGPENFVGLKVETIPPNKVTCELNECPKNCKCNYKPSGRVYLVDCTNMNITEYPEIHKPEFTDSVEVYLQNNLLKGGPNSTSGYDNVDVLNLSNNLIESFNSIPSKLKILNLDHNNFTRLNASMLYHSNVSVTLHENPWICDCLTKNFSHYIKDHVIREKSNIRCNKNGIRISMLNDAEICSTNTTLILGSAITIAVLFAIIAVLTVLYYKNSNEIKIWLYGRNLCLWFVTEEDLDKDKLYDAFISYSHVDEKFIEDELVPKLESGSYPYKLCIHTRNWIPGEFIPKQIIDSVSNSRRTIVVLSKDFLQSVWGIMEFRTAHVQALNEKLARVIVILYGDIDPNSDEIDDELKNYLKTNTYIKWNDPWFWERLRYALPHNSMRPSNNKKFDNISINIEKIDLIEGFPTPNNTSTPPAQPLLTKNNPLEFKVANNLHVTPPAEAGSNLIITTTH